MPPRLPSPVYPRRVISRRALLGTGAGVVALAGVAAYGDHAHKLDDLARTVGLDPQPRPAESDDTLIKSVRTDQSVVLASTQAVAAAYPALATALAPLITNVETQLADLGGVTANVDVAAPPAPALAALNQVITVHKRAATSRAKDSLDAVSGDFAQVLASISASLSQGVVVLRRARRELA